MRRFGATRHFGQRTVRAAAATMVAAVTLALTSGIATADNPAPAPPTATPIAGQALFMLTTLPNGWAGRTDIRPVLEIQSDGRAIKRPDATSPDRKPDVAPQQVNGTVPQDVLNAAITEAKALYTVDLGTPTVTDQGTMIIDLLPQQTEAEDVHLIVYAPDSTDGLDEDQKANRTRFATLYKKLLDAFVADR